MPMTMQAVMAAKGQIDSKKQQLLGIYQMWQAGKARKAAMKAYKENPFEVPEAQIRSVNKYGTLAKGTRMAGQDLMEENLRSDTASALAQARKSATTPSQVLASTVGLYQQQQQAQQQMNAAAAQDYQRRQSTYASALATIAPYEVERWKYKTLYPVQAGLNQASALEGTAWANIGQGMKSSANTTANLATQVGYDQELKGLLGSNTGGGGSQQNMMNPSAILSSAQPQVEAPMQQQNWMTNDAYFGGQQPQGSFVGQPMYNPYGNSWWGGAAPNRNIQQRQGTY